MRRVLVSILVIMTYGIIGYVIFSWLISPWLNTMQESAYLPVLICYILLIFLLIMLLFTVTVDFVIKRTERLVRSINSLSATELFGGVIGLIAGLVIAALFSVTISKIEGFGPYISILLMLIFGYIGLLIGSQKRDDVVQMIMPRSAYDRPEEKEKKSKEGRHSNKLTPKVLDSSVIIDGRIADIYRSGFMEGDMVVANFVLEELQHIADSSDQLKRNRGRNALDLINNMKKEFKEHVVVNNTDYDDITEVDAKLLRLAQDLRGVVVTNDFNLNKVAQVQGVKVLNINALANAVKPVVLPGEEMSAQVVKEGKESNQGIAYLEDGTMIVVENGRRFLGRNIHVIVTSILQTAAGRMIFARPKTLRNEASEDSKYVAE